METTTLTMAQRCSIRRKQLARAQKRVLRALNVGAFCMCTAVTRHNHENALRMGEMMLGKIPFVLLLGVPRRMRSEEAQAVARLLLSVQFAIRDVMARVERDADTIRCVLARSGAAVRVAAKRTVDEYVALTEAALQRTALVKKMEEEGARVPETVEERMALVATCSGATMAYLDVLAERAATLLGQEEMQAMFEALTAMRAALEHVAEREF